jgi:hypothetical protein
MKEYKSTATAIALIIAITVFGALDSEAKALKGKSSSVRCPYNYHKDGNYCMPNSKNVRHGIKRNGTCPYGYFADGDFCMKSRNK